MKKVISIVLCMLLLGAMALPVSASGAYMSLYSSAGTLYRGDSFTLTVNLSNDEPIGNGAVILSYDSSVFEMTGGSCNVSGAAVSQVSTSIGGGTFAMEADTVVSGTIFTINMRVREDAPFGTHNISGSPSLSISCGFSGTSVVVACSHNFDRYTKVDDTSHVSTCSICGEEKTDAHTWDDGKVEKEPTCKVTGTKTLTCTACKATKTETVPVSDNHQYGNWSSTGGATHIRNCSVCGKEDSASHSWNYGTVTEEATCEKTGLKTVTCTGCGATDTQTVGKTDHDWSAWKSINSKEHKRVCNVCKEEDKAAHTYPAIWEHDEQNHFHSCESCGYIGEKASHNPGPKATATTDQICTVCQRILQPMTTHEHSFTDKWFSDELGHWHVCSACGQKNGYLLHSYQDDCDDTCHDCGAKREAPHKSDGVWQHDGQNHWQLCSACGQKVALEAHLPGPAATTSAAQVCTVCQYEIEPVLPHDHVYNANGSIHWHECACGERYAADAKTCAVCKAENPQFPWWIVCIIEAALLGCAIAWLLLKRPRFRELDYYGDPTAMEQPELVDVPETEAELKLDDEPTRKTELDIQEIE